MAAGIWRVSDIKAAFHEHEATVACVLTDPTRHFQVWPRHLTGWPLVATPLPPVCDSHALLALVQPRSLWGGGGRRLSLARAQLGMALQMAGQREKFEISYEKFCEESCARHGGFANALSHYKRLADGLVAAGGDRLTDRATYNAEKMCKILTDWQAAREKRANRACVIC